MQEAFVQRLVAAPLRVALIELLLVLQVGWHFLAAVLRGLAADAYLHLHFLLKRTLG